MVTVLFDPASNGEATADLSISSNDPNESMVSLSLTGEGSLPAISLESPARAITVNAGDTYTFTWQDNYIGGEAYISLYLDNDTDPSNGFHQQIVANLSENQEHNSYAWQIPADLTGSTLHIFAMIEAESVSFSSYAPGTLHIDNTGMFRLLSPIQVTNELYSYQYDYNGILYSGSTTLSEGSNRLTVQSPGDSGATVTHEFQVIYEPDEVDQHGITYDHLGRVQSSTDGNDITTTFTYDKFEQLTDISYSTGATISLSYDLLGRVTERIDKSGRTGYTYDELDRITSVTSSPDIFFGNDDDIHIGYGYDLAGRLTELTYPDGGYVNYVYDQAGRLKEVRDNTGGEQAITLYEYDPLTGQRLRTTAPNGVTTDYGYDQAGRLTDIEYRDGAADLIALYHYEYNNAGHRSEMHVTAPDPDLDPDSAGHTVTRKEQYIYDGFGRIIKVVYSADATFDSNDRTVNYTYDANGNRISMTVQQNGSVIEDFRYYYGHENRLLRRHELIADTITTYMYDGSGNLALQENPDETIHYEYDASNLLTLVVTGADDIQFEYDGAGKRIAKIVNGVRTDYVLEPLSPVAQVLQERNIAGETTASYTYGFERISGQLPGQSDTTYYLTDGLGSTRYLIDEHGLAGSEQQYDIFGTPFGASENGNNFLFTGEQFDRESGLIYLRARYYDPATGRFISKDPLGLRAGHNMYVYVKNNPVTFTDPSGLLIQEALGVILNWGFEFLPDFDGKNTVKESTQIITNIGYYLRMAPNEAVQKILRHFVKHQLNGVLKDVAPHFFENELTQKFVGSTIALPFWLQSTQSTIAAIGTGILSSPAYVLAAKLYILYAGTKIAADVWRFALPDKYLNDNVVGRGVEFWSNEVYFSPTKVNHPIPLGPYAITNYLNMDIYANPNSFQNKQSNNLSSITKRSNTALVNQILRPNSQNHLAGAHWIRPGQTNNPANPLLEYQ